MLIAQESSESGLRQRQATVAAGGQLLRRPDYLPFGPIYGSLGQRFDELIKAEQKDAPTIEQLIYCRFFYGSCNKIPDENRLYVEKLSIAG